MERAVKLDKDDPSVHLYLGIEMSKTDETMLVTERRFPYEI